MISAALKAKKDGGISLREDSYLHMMCQSLDIDKEELYGQNTRYCILLNDDKAEVVSKPKMSYLEHSLKPLTFESKKLVSATESTQTKTNDNTAANLGIATHKIIELYWDSFEANQEAILEKMMVFETPHREEITENMNNFYKSDVYTLLKDGVEHHFELEFNVEDKTGFIDFMYFDTASDGWIIVDFKTGFESDDKNSKYQEQLDFYEDTVKSLGYKVIDTRLLWLSTQT